MRKLSLLTAFVLLIGAVTLVSTGMDVATTRAADHLDSPGVTGDGRTDINDMYIFRARKKKKETAMIMTVAPLAGLASPTVFSDAAKYNFNIDNDGDFKFDLQWTAEFDGDTMTVSLDGVEMGSGPIARKGNQRAAPIKLTGGGQATAGLYDDPFFFDLAAAQDLAAGTPLEEAFCTENAFDFFQNANVLGIVLDVRNTSLGVEARGGAVAINYWGSTQVGKKQIDRAADPFLNTFLGSPRQNAYNKNKKPHKDPKKFGPTFTTNLMGLGADTATATGLVALFLPDVMNYSPRAPRARVFPNGRGLSDDVADISLQILAGVPGASDCIAANDGKFSKKFPYLADAH